MTKGKAPVAFLNQLLFWVGLILQLLSVTRLISFQECCKEEAGDDEENVLNVIDAFDVPRFSYSEELKKYVPDSTLDLPKPKIYAGSQRCHMLTV